MVTTSGKFIKLGRKSNITHSAPPPLKISVGPAKYAFISMGKLYIDDQHIPHDKMIKQVTVGGGHTVFLDEDGDIYGFGNNLNGQLGQKIYKEDGELENYILKPIKIPISNVKKVVAGHEHTVVLDNKGKAYHFGSTYKEVPNNDDITFLRDDVQDIYARCNLTLLLFTNGDLEQIGNKS